MAAIGDAKTCPHGHPIVLEERVRGSLLADCEVGAKVGILRFENEAEELLHYLRDAGLETGLEGTVKSSDERGGRDRLRRRRAHRLPQRRRDGLGGRRPGPAAPGRAARGSDLSAQTATAADPARWSVTGLWLQAARSARESAGSPQIWRRRCRGARRAPARRSGRGRPAAGGLVVANRGGQRVEAPLHVAPRHLVALILRDSFEEADRHRAPPLFLNHDGGTDRRDLCQLASSTIQCVFLTAC